MDDVVLSGGASASFDFEESGLNWEYGGLAAGAYGSPEIHVGPRDLGAYPAAYDEWPDCPLDGNVLGYHNLESGFSYVFRDFAYTPAIDLTELDLLSLEDLTLRFDQLQDYDLPFDDPGIWRWTRVRFYPDTCPVTGRVQWSRWHDTDLTKLGGVAGCQTQDVSRLTDIETGLPRRGRGRDRKAAVRGGEAAKVQPLRKIRRSRCPGSHFILQDTLQKATISYGMNWNRRTPKSTAGQRPLADAQLVNRLAPSQGGVFSKADLQVTLADPHPASFGRRVRLLVAGGILTRFARNWYVAPGFDPATLSQRLAPISYVSFTTVLAEALLVGPAPERRITAVRVGRNRIYESGGYVVEHVGIAQHLFFGFGSRDGVCYADPEKAALDVLYFHLRGRRYPFDVYSDIDRTKLDTNRVRQYLSRYRNARFVAFAKQLLEIV